MLLKERETTRGTKSSRDKQPTPELACSPAKRPITQEPTRQDTVRQVSATNDDTEPREKTLEPNPRDTHMPEENRKEPKPRMKNPKPKPGSQETSKQKRKIN